MNKMFAIIAVLCLGAVVWGAAEQQVDKYGGQFPFYLNKGLYVGRDNQNPSRDTKNKVVAMPGCTVDYDFPAIIAAPGYHVFTPSYTCTGVRVGDPCFVGVAKATPNDGGSAWEEQMDYRAIAKADNRIVIMALSVSGDAGAVHPPHAGYNVRCVSNVVQ